MSSQTVISKGIFHGLPTFPQYDGKKLTAIVTGANGISGSAMIKVLSEAPQRWEKVYALSRRPATYPATSNVVSIAVDFLDATPEAIAKVLKDHHVMADYVFFASYVQPPPLPGQGLWTDQEAMTKMNVALLSNFLTALPIASIKPKRVLLQTGAKYYGVHLGPTPTPMEEDDPRHGIEPNFYFPQEDVLYDWCRKNGSSWVVTRPGFILGAVEGAAMNIVYPLAIYAAVQAHLSRPLEFPADIPAWDAEKHQSTAALLAYHAEWALLTPEAGDKALNQSDTSAFSWGKFWPVLASWYHIPAGRPTTTSDDNPTTNPTPYRTFTLPYPTSPRGFGGPGRVNSTFSFMEWSQKPEVQAAWKELAAKHGIAVSDQTNNPFEPKKAMDTFGLLDGEILGGWGRVISMDRSRKLGWNGFVDTKEAIKGVIQDMVGLGVLPPFPSP